MDIMPVTGMRSYQMFTFMGFHVSLRNNNNTLRLSMLVWVFSARKTNQPTKWAGGRAGGRAGSESTNQQGGWAGGQRTNQQNKQTASQPNQPTKPKNQPTIQPTDSK